MLFGSCSTIELDPDRLRRAWGERSLIDELPIKYQDVVDQLGRSNDQSLDGESVFF